MFAIKITAAPDHSDYCVGKLLRNKDGVAIRSDKPKLWNTRKGATRNIPVWEGFKFEVVEVAQ